MLSLLRCWFEFGLKAFVSSMSLPPPSICISFSASGSKSDKCPRVRGPRALGCLPLSQVVPRSVESECRSPAAPHNSWRAPRSGAAMLNEKRAIDDFDLYGTALLDDWVLGRWFHLGCFCARDGISLALRSFSSSTRWRPSACRAKASPCSSVCCHPRALGCLLVAGRAQER